ncbi:MAG: archaemetzincin family Zn-dependent metalloprotease [Candidatus Bathyarchaeia archaeon]
MRSGPPKEVQWTLRLTVLTVGDIDSSLVRRVLTRVQETLGVEEVQLRSLPSSFIAEAHNAKRNQYQSDKVLSKVKKLPDAQGVDAILTLVDVDLYVGGLNFIFGQAESPGKMCLVSLHRLHPSEDSSNGGLLESRLLKEVVHELGHTLGLNHCSNMVCVMYFSNTLADTDRKSHEFCNLCQTRVRGLKQ